MVNNPSVFPLFTAHLESSRQSTAFEAERNIQYNLKITVNHLYWRKRHTIITLPIIIVTIATSSLGKVETEMMLQPPPPCSVKRRQFCLLQNEFFILIPMKHFTGIEPCSFPSLHGVLKRRCCATAYSSLVGFSCSSYNILRKS